jgi:hypothetical protein
MSELSAAGRAHWLAELSDALSDAQRLTWLIGAGGSHEAMELYGRIEAALNEAQALRFGGFGARHREPASIWVDLAPWPTPKSMQRD